MAFNESVGPTGLRTITAEPGQNVILPCKAPSQKEVTALDWRRTDLHEGNVLGYRDGQLEVERQHPSFKNRVHLQGTQMNDRNLSVMLLNVTAEDTGTYVCQVNQDGEEPRKMISTVYLKVAPAGVKDGENPSERWFVPAVCVAAAGLAVSWFLKR